MHEARVLAELHLGIERLARAAGDHPALAASLRRFAASLPSAPADARSSVGPANPTAIARLLREARASGALDGRGFDYLMVARDLVSHARAIL
jgi:hypothetical protein